MTERVQGAKYRLTMVCVDENRDGSFSGRLYNPYWPEGVGFTGVLDFLEKMEDLLDRMKLPQAFTARRTFGDPSRGGAVPPPEGGHQGKLATFRLQILFRQNASWQGMITWMEGRQEEDFRSVLELLLMMSSALGASGRS
jgi:hypothetical protein